MLKAQVNMGKYIVHGSVNHGPFFAYLRPYYFRGPKEP